MTEAVAVFLLIGWIDGVQSGGVVNIEFTTEKACMETKALFQERHSIKRPEDRWAEDSWVECVKK